MGDVTSSSMSMSSGGCSYAVCVAKLLVDVWRRFDGRSPRVGFKMEPSGEYMMGRFPVLAVCVENDEELDV